MDRFVDIRLGVEMGRGLGCDYLDLDVWILFMVGMMNKEDRLGLWFFLSFFLWIGGKSSTGMDRTLAC